MPVDDISPVGLFIITFIVIIIGLVTVQQSAQNIEQIDIESLSINQTILAESSDTLTTVGLGIISSDVKVNNKTWINCTTSDSLVVDINKSKATVSVWFANSTTDWTSLIKSGGDIYIDGYLDAGWTWIPYYVSGDDLIFCKSDISTFLDVSIDAIRVYENALNSTEALEVYEYGR